MMNASHFTILLLASMAVAPIAAQAKDDPTNNSLDAEPVSALQPENDSVATVAILPDDELEKLLEHRINNQLGGTFAQFANMFLVSSRIQLGTGIALATPSRKIAQTNLQSIYPETYQPTLREILDLAALESFSQWKYETTGKYLNSEKRMTKPVKGLAIFEFTETIREKPYQVSVAKGWTVRDKGNWVMYTPPDFPVGMDIYEAGTYSTDNKREEKEFLEQVRIDVALMWALRVDANATQDDLKPAKIGSFEALSYDTIIRGKDGQKYRWRHWVFLDGPRCYFIASTIPPFFENDLFPDVERMLASFEIKPLATR